MAPTSWEECEETKKKYNRFALSKQPQKRQSIGFDDNDQDDDDGNEDDDEDSESKRQRQERLLDLAIPDPLNLEHTYRQSHINRMNWMAATSDNGDIYVESDKYNPRLFLATKHHALKYENLGLAKTNLNKTINDLKMKMILLSEKNIHKFTEAKDTVDSLCANKDAKFRDGSVSRLDQVLQNVQEDSDNLFMPLIQRKKGKLDRNEANSFFRM